MQNRPPFLLHLLAIAFLASALVNLAGIVQAVHSWNWLTAAGYYPSPIYVIIKDIILGLSGLVAAAANWARFPFAPRFSQVTAGVTFAWYWVDRIVLTRNSLPFKDHLFPLLVSLLLLVFVIVSAWLLEPFMRDFIGGKEENDA